MTAKTQPRKNQGFTLVELIVVIAIIVILAVVIIPAVGLFGGGKNLPKTGNAISAYIAGLRSKALTSQRSVVVVLLPRRSDINNLYQIRYRLPDGKTDAQKGFSGGFVAYEARNESDFEDPTKAANTELYSYMNADLNFDEEIDDAIVIHPKKLEAWSSNNELAKSLKDDLTKLKDVGAVPASGPFFLFVIRPDGRVDIPYDVPVTQIDEEASIRDGDIVLTNNDQTMIIDISRYAKVTNRIYRREAMQGSKYRPAEEE